MVTLHVTRELARSLKLPEQLQPQADGSASILGGWSLGLAHCRPVKLVVAVNVTTRWAMAIHAAPLATLQKRFGPALLLNLLALGVPPDRARAEADAQMPAQWALGHTRGVLTHLNQCVADALWAVNDGLSLPSLNQRLAERIIIKPQTGRPSAEVLRLLGGRPDNLDSLKRAEGENWNETYELMQAQAGQEVVTMPVHRLVGSERLEARHQASILMQRLPVDTRRELSTGRFPRWVPRELVLDLERIELVSPMFAIAIRHEAMELGVQRITLVNALDEVAQPLIEIR